jgi:hypothetical protein
MILDPNKDVWSKDLVCWERGQEAGRKRPISEDIAFKNLLEIKEVFDKHGILFWLTHGTCLSVVRDNRLAIPWDDDIDLGALASQRDLAETVLPELRAKGFYIAPSIKGQPVSKENAPWSDLHIIKDGEKAEFWFWTKIGNQYVYDPNRPPAELHHDAKYYDTLGTILLKGKSFNTPNHLQEWLVMMYGPTWQTPDENRKYNKS